MRQIWTLLAGPLVVLAGGCGSADRLDRETAGEHWATEATLPVAEAIAFYGFELVRGDVVRYRVEPVSADLDSVIGVVTEHELAQAASREYASTFPENAANFYTVPASQRFHGDLREYSETDAYNDVDAGGAGEAEASVFLVNRDGTYTVAIGTAPGSPPGAFRLVVERWESSVDDDEFGDADALNTILSGNFFTDASFYAPTGRFDPDA